MKVLTSLAGASALCLAAPACKGGYGHADAIPERVSASLQGDGVEEEPPASVLALVLDPDDEAFGMGAEDGGTGRGPACGDGAGPAEVDGQVYTAKGVLRKVDGQAGIIVVDQLLENGERHDVRFRVDSGTQVGWSKASMEMDLSDLPAGLTIFVTYTVVQQGELRGNRALKIVIPGGMEDVARMILGEPDHAASVH
jgi:hypothetical protein